MPFYPWLRFWCRVGGSYRTDENGYLLDPNEYLHDDYADKVFPLTRTEGSGFVAMLGDPGMGKSTELGREYERLKASRQNQNQGTIFENLNHIDNAQRFESEVFTSGVRRLLADGKDDIVVCLDAFDECRQSVRTLSRLLRREIDRLGQDVEKVQFRVACRTAEWPPDLTEWAAKKWGEGRVAEVELCPLRRIDVEVAALARNLQASEFLSAIQEAEAQPWAMLPFSLEMLLNRFGQHEAIPQSRVELYRLGAEWTVTEQNDSRIESRRAGMVTPMRRLAIAKRIAALMIFGSRQTLDLERPFQSRDEALAVHSVGGVDPHPVLRESAINEDEAKEVAGTALFSSRGRGLVGFALRSSGEFLAASYLSDLRVGPEQAKLLFFSPELPTGPIPEQIAETAAWFAALSPSFRVLLLEADPAVLVRADPGSLNDSERISIAQRYLAALARSEAIDSFELHDHYRRLRCPELAGALREYITDRSANRIVRRAAIEIAEACQERALAPELASIAFDLTEDPHCREYAARALLDLGSPEIRLRFREFLNEDSSSDPDDQLRGYALRALWPEHITARELFQSFGIEHNSSFYGSYALFLYGPFLQHLRAEDLPHAIDWASEQGPDHAISFSVREIVGEIHRRGWLAINDTAVLEAMTRLAERRFRDHASLCPDIRSSTSSTDRDEPPFTEDDRRRLLESLFPRIAQVHGVGLHLVRWSKPWVTHVDAEWLVRLALSRPGDAVVRMIGDVLWNLLDKGGDQYVSLLEMCVEASRRSSALQAVLEPWWGPMRLDSDDAREARRSFLARRKVEEDFAARDRRDAAPPEVAPSDQVQDLLNRLESGETEAWWYLNEVLHFEETGRSRHDWFFLDLRGLPGWTFASEAVRIRILSGALTYLSAGSSRWEDWFLRRRWHPADVSALRAFVLLSYENPGALDRLTDADWRKWKIALIASPGRLGEADVAANVQALLRRAYVTIPAAIIEDVCRIAREVADEYAFQEAMHRLETCWDQTLCDAVLPLLREESLRWEIDTILLDKLIKLRFQGGLELALERIALEVPSQDSRRRRVEAARQLALYCGDLAWSQVWAQVVSDNEFGVELIGRLVGDWDWGHGGGLGSLADSIGEAAVGELHVWLARQYPRSADEEIHGVHAVGPREIAQHARDGTLNWLVKRGTPAALEAIRSIQNQLQGDGIVDWRLIEARRQVALKTWIPLEPETLLQVVSDPRTRLLRSESDLALLAVEILGDIQRDLHGENLLVRFLWIPSGESGQRPRDEESLADWISGELKTRLNSRGTILGFREVRTRPAIPASPNSARIPGERVDILLTALVGVSHIAQEFRIIIECKGCWNRDRDSALDTQLSQRYLTHGPTSTGIYLVGAYDCSQWDPDDSRHASRFRQSPEELRGRLVEQASRVRGVTVIPYVLDVSLR